MPFKTCLYSVNMDLLKNKMSLVTGSSREIGADIGRLFAQEGTKVVLNGRDTIVLSQVQLKIELRVNFNCKTRGQVAAI